MSVKIAEGIKKFGIPNWLSVLRLLLIPVFIVVYFQNIKYSGVIAALTLIFSGLTDVADGIIARKYNLTSAVGKILDPLADKLTQATICICLVVNKAAPEWILYILIAKEFIMIIVGANFIRKGKELISSKWFGKVGTVLFYVAMISIIAFKPRIEIVYLMLSVVLIFMIFSFIMYIPSALKLLKNHKNQNNN